MTSEEQVDAWMAAKWTKSSNGAFYQVTNGYVPSVWKRPDGTWGWRLRAPGDRDTHSRESFDSRVKAQRSVLNELAKTLGLERRC